MSTALNNSHADTAVSSPTERAELLAGADWGLTAIRTGERGSLAAILTSDGELRDISGIFDGRPNVLELLAQWPAVAGKLEGLNARELPTLPDAKLDLLMRFPPKLIFAGANYHSHVQEMGGEVPAGAQPFFFLKPPSTTLNPDGGPLTVPASGSRFDWEAELGVVIGRHAKHLTKENALEHVAGYVVINDITDRSRLKREGPILGPPFAWDWLSSKAQDGSCPIGSVLVPASLVPDPTKLQVRLWLNDELMQDDSTGNMVVDIPTLLESITSVFTLEPGDILATGTPAGVGSGRERYLNPGDVVTTEVSGVGRVRTPIVAAA